MLFLGSDKVSRKVDAIDRSRLVLSEAVNELPMNDIGCPDLREIGKVWLNLPRADGDTLPSWSDFNPSMIVRYLSKMSILHVGDWRNDEIEFTLFGDHLTRHIGNGRPLDLQQLKSDPDKVCNYIDIVERAGRAVEFAAPQYARKSLIWDGHEDVQYELLVLPFLPEEGISRVLQPLSSQPRPT